MINIRSIVKLTNNDGLTLKAGKKVVYKTGWQVATHGVECKTARECINAVKAYDGNCGVWFADGIYYVDYSFRVDTKKKALEKELGYVVRQILVERNAKSCSKLRALWNGTHMRDFGVIVCLCKHLAHRATGIVDTCFKGPTDWIVFKAHNDNCKIIADSVRAEIRKSGRSI
jgi:hypothetical protein